MRRLFFGGGGGFWRTGRCFWRGGGSEEGEVFGRGLRAGLRDDGLRDDASGRLLGGVACDRHMREPPCGVVMCDRQPWALACGVMLRGHHLCARVGAAWCVNTCWHASGVAVRDIRARRAGACVRSGVVRPPFVRACLVMVRTQEARMGACHRGCYGCALAAAMLLSAAERATYGATEWVAFYHRLPSAQPMAQALEEAVLF